MKSALEPEIAGRPLTDREAAAPRAFDYIYGQEYKALVQADPMTEFERLYGGAGRSVNRVAAIIWPDPAENARTEAARTACRRAK